MADRYKASWESTGEIGDGISWVPSDFAVRHDLVTSQHHFEMLIPVGEAELSCVDNGTILRGLLFRSSVKR